METQNTNPEISKTSETTSNSNNNHGRIFGGLIVVTIGAVLLAERVGVYFPNWFLSWGTLLIAIGLYIGTRHSFRGFTWLGFITIGTLGLIDTAGIIPDLSIDQYVWPLIIIFIGLNLIFRPRYKKNKGFRNWGNDYDRQQILSDDYIDSVNIFGGSKKNIISKDFKGGDLTAIFGANELNLSQADFNGRVTLEVTNVFGGTKLIIPPHWHVQSSEVVCIFGGMDDKRPVQNTIATDTSKVIILRGTCVFGGIDIKSY
jgi:hypothetical protein